MRSALAALALAALYVAAARIGFLAAPTHEVVSSAWPPAGIALAALVLLGPRLWPGVAGGALIANLTSGVALPAAVGIAAGNTLEALAGFWLLRTLEFRPAMDRLRDVLVFALAAVTVTAVSATIGVSSLWLGGAAAPGAFGTMWLAWWTGDAIGILVVAPLLLAWAAGATQKVLVPVALESAVLVLVVVALAVILFGSDFQYAYPLFPVAMFAAYRLGARGAAVANVTVAVVVAFFTVRGLGPFVVATATAIESLFLFQVFVALLTITTLSSAAVLAERRRAEAELRLSEAHLAAAQSVAQLGSWRWDVAENRVVWSDELYRIYGLDRTTFQATLEAFLERVHPEDRERVAGAVGRALTERGAFQLDERIVRPDGAVRVLESRGTVLSGLDRGVVMIGVCQDVTEARRAQRTLAASESKFSTMFHASPVAICVIAMAKLEVVDANARFLEMLGSPRQAIVGRSPKDLGMWTEPGELRDVVARLRRQRSVRETPVRYVTREGQERRALAALELVEIDGQECALALLWRP